MNVYTVSRTLNNKKAFTLVEIMIVLAILGAIFAMLSGRVIGARDKAKVKEAKIQMGQITNALSNYNLDCGKYPKALDGLAKQDDCSNWGPDPYYRQKLKDPWNNDYYYELSGSEYILKSYGKDGKEGGSAFNKDIPSDEESSGEGNAESEK